MDILALVISILALIIAVTRATPRTPLQDQREAWVAEGRAAYRTGLDLPDRPYADTTPATFWVDGWKHEAKANPR